MTLKKATIKNKIYKDLNVLIAKELMGWKEIQAPQYDFDGPLPEQGKVLVPPGFDEETYQWPNRGVVPYSFFVTQEYSKDMNMAMQVVAAMKSSGFEFMLITGTCEKRGLIYTASFLKNQRGGKVTKTGTSTQASVAICLAAVGLRTLLKRQSQRFNEELSK
ncbi:BC1872 family protein [Bdellovibrio sp. BCCA]|uniref:BC1872 family protein n=1 Tax=Bdellovibrio sp. BCCA TaxID=3136281 RepID=UPI0030F1725C